MIEESRNMKMSNNPTLHNVVMENREKLSVSGVLDVESFDDENVVLQTELGVLVIKGQELHINKLNIDNAELIVEGDIVSLTYTDSGSSRDRESGLFSRLFR